VACFGSLQAYCVLPDPIDNWLIVRGRV